MTEGKQIYYHRLRENSRKMHPRLKELAVEAGAYEDGGAILHGPMDIAKFAELIVKECTDIVKPTSHHEVWAQSYLGGVDGLDLLHSKIKDIKKHFGVE